MTIAHDMPKIECPFVRKTNEKGEYLVTPEITPGCEWVFNDPGVLAVEKLDGTNISIVLEGGQITSIWNRKEQVPFFKRGKVHLMEGVLEAFQKGYCDLADGQWFGELLGPKVNGNPYKLERHIWIPFATYAKERLAYKSWGKYPKTFEAINDWFKTLMPLFAMRIHGRDVQETAFAEGVVFTHTDGRMAKLRKDMFDWFTGRRHNE